MWLTANGMLSLWSVLWTVLSWACPRPDHRPYLPSTLHLIPHILHNLGYRLYLSICEFLMCREPQPITNWANKPNKEPGNQQPNTPTHQDSNKNRPKLCQKSTKKITKHQWVVWGALGASWDHLAKTPQDTQKAFQVTPPPWGPKMEPTSIQNRSGSLPKRSQFFDWFWGWILYTFCSNLVSAMVSAMDCALMSLSNARPFIAANACVVSAMDCAFLSLSRACPDPVQL